MSENNNLSGTLPKNEQDNDQRKMQSQINSLDFLIQVDRLPIGRSQAQGIYLYGLDNNYPRKITQASKRSSELVKAKQKQALFLQGLGFPGATAMDVKNETAVVINSKGQTAYDLLQFCAQQKTNINIAIHVNYNILGEAVEFNLIQYDFVRRKIKTSQDQYTKYIIADIWHVENDYFNYGYAARMMEFNQWVKDKETKLSFIALECFDYNPDPKVVREQIELSGGIDKYPGQLFYKKRTQDIYQEAVYDSVADDFQFLAESKLASLSNIQNGYSASGVFKYFATQTGTQEIEDLKKKLNNARGAGNTGRIITHGVPPSSDMSMANNMFEPTEMQNIDKLYDLQKKNARESIKQLYSQPSALNGEDTTGNFATQNMQETFDFYNSVTEPLRQELEIELTHLFKNSVFANQITLPIEIEPLKYISRIETTEKQNDNETINNDN